MGELGDRLDELRNTRDLISVFDHETGRQVRRVGRGFSANCPFHDDKNPSFVMWQGDNGGWYWRCYGGSCGVEGDLIDFVGYNRFGGGWNRKDFKQLERVVEILDGRGPNPPPPVKITSAPPPLKIELSRRSRFIWKAILDLYAETLNSDEGKAAMEYLKSRRLPESIFRKYKVGFAPLKSPRTKAIARMLRFSDDELVEAGVFREGKKGLYECCRGRVVFADVEGSARLVNYVVSRTFPDCGLWESAPRYLTLAGYQKPLFGIGAMGGGRTPIILTEGPIDKFTVEAWGYDAVALMAAHPTPTQMAILIELQKTRPITPLVDNDAGGAAALDAWREMFPQLAEPIKLPPVVDGIAIKDANDLAKKLPEGVGQKIFFDVARRAGVRPKK